ncbi:FliH/SctL family protein [Novosphingobium bradum]|uniref:Flagellar assembly protein FliH n=1 Tax=Novosphingobium bradum TaxID=1737444 RepID=A0ABV7IXL3_9SPHN
MSSLAALAAGGGEPGGFRSDARFALPVRAARAPAEPEPVQIADPVALAWAEGYARGRDEARAEAGEAAKAEAEARGALALSLTRLDADLAESLRQRLQDTVLALCEQTLAPYALDPEVLARRIERAVAMFARAEDERVIRLHPDDIALIADGLGAGWTVVPDPALERGALRVESQSGGVEDGPAQWRRALTEAFNAC